MYTLTVKLKIPNTETRNPNAQSSWWYAPHPEYHRQRNVARYTPNPKP